MHTDSPTIALKAFDEATQRHARVLLDAFCDEHRIDIRLFDGEELQAAVEDALSAPAGSPDFADRLRGQCLGYLHGKMVELARDGFVLPTSLDVARYDAFAAELERRFGEIQPREVGLYVYGVVDPQSGRSFEVELPGRKLAPESTLDAGDAPLGYGKTHLPRLREAISARRIGVNEASGPSPRRVPLSVFAAVLDEEAPVEVIGPIAVR